MPEKAYLVVLTNEDTLWLCLLTHAQWEKLDQSLDLCAAMNKLVVEEGPDIAEFKSVAEFVEHCRRYAELKISGEEYGVSY